MLDGARSVQRTVILGLGFALTFTACATSPRVKVERVEGSALAGYDTFAVRPDAVGSNADPALGPEALREAQEELTLSLRGRSYRLATPGDAQLLVAVGTTMGSRLQGGDSMIHPGGYDVVTREAVIATPIGGVPVARDTAVVPRTDVISSPASLDVQRTVVVDVFDAKTQQLLWRGTSTMRGGSSQHIDLDDLRERVRAIAARFPGS